MPAQRLDGVDGPEHVHRPDYSLSVPFDGWTSERMNRAVDRFVETTGLHRYENDIRRGAFLAQDKKAFPLNPGDAPRTDNLVLDDTERELLKLEYSPRRIDKFKQSWRLYALIGVCSMGAAVQGWDETAVNGAQIYYNKAFQIQESEGLRGLVNSAPYLCCALSCWLTYPINYFIGRRGTIFLTCLISCVTCLAQAFPMNWYQLFIARFLLGFGIGPKSATIPIYAAECAPAHIRGALVMMWQMFTAFGIMCGFISGVILRGVNEGAMPVCNPEEYDAALLLSARCSLHWRLMLASPMILPIIVFLYVYTLPESPRWLLAKARRTSSKPKYREAFQALERLRLCEVQAGRDLFLIHHLLEAEENEIRGSRNPFVELFTVGRNRRALTASLITMFLQQFCGVNVMAYYSSDFLHTKANFTPYNAFLASMGFGIINFVFALPAVWTIDTFGRRNLLLSTFPLMSIFQLLVAIGFAFHGNARTVLVLVGMYLFSVAYSPGEGPVPFVYSAESMPLYNRDFGMGLVTAVNWFFNFFLAITWPAFVRAFGDSGAFAWYAGWCAVGWWLILLLVPETKDLSLEELDDVFQKGTRAHVTHGLRELRYVVGRFVLRQRKRRRPILIARRDSEDDFAPEGSPMATPMATFDDGGRNDFW